MDYDPYEKSLRPIIPDEEPYIEDLSAELQAAEDMITELSAGLQTAENMIEDLEDRLITEYDRGWADGRMEVQAVEHNRIKDNEYLIGERDAALSRVKETGK